MKKMLFVGLVVFMLLVSFTFAATPEDRREAAKDKMEDKAKDAMKDKVKDEGKDATKDKMSAVKKAANRKEIREMAKKKVGDLTKDDVEKHLKMRKELKDKVKEKCDDVKDELQKAVCDKESVAYRALEKVRERHRLSEACKKLTGQDRSACELKINGEFKDVVQANFKEWVKTRKKDNETGNETEELDKKERVRLRIKALHDKIKEQRLNETDNAGSRNLLKRLDAAIDKAERVSEHMEKAIDRAEEKGHDVTKLKFILEEYDKAVDNAKVFFDDKQYKDALASLKEAKSLFKEFRKTFADLVSEHKKGRKYKEKIDGEVPDVTVPEPPPEEGEEG